MITQRVAYVLASEINGTAWERACLALALDPSSATAEEVLGPFPTRLTHSGGQRVFSWDTELVADVPEEERAAVPVQSTKAFVAEVAEIASLTRLEARLVHAIVDGSTLPGGRGYTEPLARRFRTTHAAIRQAWKRAKKKLQEHWAA